ncbi:MAG: MBL fold metallo-hydrolase [Dehalococcoidia bacterium]|nr:MBL fold metallo-hydrolase [Dehalococcoidia bacterium]
MTAHRTFQSFRLGFTWCYLLKCRDGYVLIDTSYPGYFQPFQKCIARLGIDMSEIKYLLLTHHHDDHSGFAAELVRKTACRVIAHPNAVAPLKKGESEDTVQPVNLRVKFVFSIFQLFHRGFRFPPLSLAENDFILTGDNDDLLKNIGIDGRILYTPGHSRDSLSVLLSDGSAFVGDVAMNFLRPTGIGHRPIFVEDINTVYASWQRLVEEGAKVIYPSHGKPFSSRELVG